jgi:hypothetical protein
MLTISLFCHRTRDLFNREYSSTADQSDISAIVSTTRSLLDADFDDLVDGKTDEISIYTLIPEMDVAFGVSTGSNNKCVTR